VDALHVEPWLSETQARAVYCGLAQCGAAAYKALPTLFPAAVEDIDARYAVLEITRQLRSRYLSQMKNLPRERYLPLPFSGSSLENIQLFCSDVWLEENGIKVVEQQLRYCDDEIRSECGVRLVKTNEHTLAILLKDFFSYGT